MSSSKIVTRNDLRDVLNEIVPIMETSIVSEAEDIVETVAPDIVDDYVSSSAFTAAILDVFYPVGCYFETSDTTFNPNTAWGGTWVLETEGQVHVSSGTNYTVSGAGTNTTDGGAQTVTLNAAQIPAHGHNVKSWVDAGTLGTAKWWTNNGTELTNVTAGRHFTSTSGSWTSGTFTTAQEGTGDQTGMTTQSGGGQAHNNMPPYIVVNRWHRTA